MQKSSLIERMTRQRRIILEEMQIPGRQTVGGDAGLLGPKLDGGGRVGGALEHHGETGIDTDY